MPRRPLPLLFSQSTAVECRVGGWLTGKGGPALMHSLLVCVRGGMVGCMVEWWDAWDLVRVGGYIDCWIAASPGDEGVCNAPKNVAQTCKVARLHSSKVAQLATAPIRSTACRHSLIFHPPTNGVSSGVADRWLIIYQPAQGLPLLQSAGNWL